MVGKIYPNRLDPKDPLFAVKAEVINSNNYLHDKTREDKEKLFTKFYFAISLLFTAITTVLVGYWGWISVLILAILLAIFLGISFSRYKKQRESFWKNRDQMKETFKSLKLEWKD